MERQKYALAVFCLRAVAPYVLLLLKVMALTAKDAPGVKKHPAQKLGIREKPSGYSVVTLNTRFMPPIVSSAVVSVAAEPEEVSLTLTLSPMKTCPVAEVNALPFIEY